MLPSWFSVILNQYSSLKTEQVKCYFIFNLEEVNSWLSTCILLRLDDSEGPLNIKMRTREVQNSIKINHPQFTNCELITVIAKNGTNINFQEDFHSLFIVPNNNKYTLYYYSIDDNKSPKIIHNDFKEFFVNIKGELLEAKSGLMLGKKTIIKSMGENVAQNFYWFPIKVRPKKRKSLDKIIKTKFYTSFDIEGFVVLSDYKETLSKLLKLTPFSYSIIEKDMDTNILELVLNGYVYQLEVAIEGDYFDISLIEKLNTINSILDTQRKFYEIYPSSVYNLDQTISIGYLTIEEIYQLKKYEYVN